MNISKKPRKITILDFSTSLFTPKLVVDLSKPKIQSSLKISKKGR